MIDRIPAGVLIILGALLLADATRAQNAPEHPCVRDIQRICPQEEIDTGERAIKECIRRDWRWFSEKCRYEIWVQAVPALAVSKPDVRPGSD